MDRGANRSTFTPSNVPMQHVMFPITPISGAIKSKSNCTIFVNDLEVFSAVSRCNVFMSTVTGVRPDIATWVHRTGRVRTDLKVQGVWI